MNAIFQTLLLKTLSRLSRGSLELRLPSGKIHRFGGLGKDLNVRLDVVDDAFFRRSVLGGPIGFAESYMAGEWTTPDLTRLLAWFILNGDDALETPERRTRGWLLNVYNRWLHQKRHNSVASSRRNIGDHYDLSNEFFQLWLDPTMTYSSAYFDPPTLSLEEAQIEKYDQLCRKLQLKPSDHVLEIGSGWGGFSLHAARKYDCRITTVTISEQQYREASARIAAAGLQDRIDIRMEDYRHIRGTFDKIVSIEMLEAVGDAYVDGYFAKCQELLKPRGLLGLQAILCPDQQYPILRDGVDFIQKHIFPGSLLMSVGRIGEAMRHGTGFTMLDYDDMGPHYAKTLKIWRDNFEAKLHAVRALGFDETFIRKWRYYLCYCEAAFATRHITVAQLIYTRPDNIAIHSPAYDLFS